ncbi:hypothetical protein THAOC_33637, partial [Thalassiosira oceanica]
MLLDFRAFLPSIMYVSRHAPPDQSRLQARPRRGGESSGVEARPRAASRGEELLAGREVRGRGRRGSRTIKGVMDVSPGRLPQTAAAACRRLADCGTVQPSRACRRRARACRRPAERPWRGAAPARARWRQARGPPDPGAVKSPVVVHVQRIRREHGSRSTARRLRVDNSAEDTCETSFDGTATPIQWDAEEDISEEVWHIIDAAVKTGNVRADLLESYTVYACWGQKENPGQQRNLQRPSRTTLTTSERPRPGEGIGYLDTRPPEPGGLSLHPSNTMSNHARHTDHKKPAGTPRRILQTMAASETRDDAAVDGEASAADGAGGRPDAPGSRTEGAEKPRAKINIALSRKKKPKRAVPNASASLAMGGDRSSRFAEEYSTVAEEAEAISRRRREDGDVLVIPCRQGADEEEKRQHPLMAGRLAMLNAGRDNGRPADAAEEDEAMKSLIESAEAEGDADGAGPEKSGGRDGLVIAAPAENKAKSR